MKRLAVFFVIGILLLTACSSPTPEVVENTAAPEETVEPTEEVVPTEIPPTEPAPTATATEMPTPEPGADGIGDPYFPQMGNGGYDVQHYTIKLDVDIEQEIITGTTTLEIIAMQDMSAFNLDFFGLDISEIRLDDSPVEFSRNVGELTITPSEPLAEGQFFTVEVDYSGTPGEDMPEDIPGYDFGAGWNFYEDGVYVAGEPAGSSNWYPVNEHPLDKALYTYEITVPKPYVVAANGLLQDAIEDEDTVTYIWDSQYPMASYLVTVNVAEFDVEEETGPDGLPIRNYFQQDVPLDVRAEFDVTADAIEFYSEIFGPYPFEAYGAVVHNMHLGFALETQTISIFGGTFATEEAIVHELAHQWFGDSVSLEEWEDIWLNEGFATYASLLWAENQYGKQAIEEYIEYLYSTLAGGVVGVFDKPTLVEVMNTLMIEVPEGTLLSSEQVEMALDALVGGVVSEEDIKAAAAEVPEEGISPDEFPSLLNTLDFVQTELNMNDVITLEWAIGLSETEPTDTSLLIGSPPADNLFDSQVYDRGALTLHALRLEVGDEAFFEIMPTYYEKYQNGNARIEDFIAIAEEISGQELDDLFDAWLYQEDLPDIPQMDLYLENFVE